MQQNKRNGQHMSSHRAADALPTIQGGGFVTSPGNGKPSHARNDVQQSTTHIYNSNYQGATYAVKYLGIVDGTMGILSRKMALEGSGNPSLAPVNFNAPTQPYCPSPKRRIDFGNYDKALGKKSYTIQRQGEFIQHSVKLLIESEGESRNDQNLDQDLTSSFYAAKNVSLVVKPRNEPLMEQVSVFQSQAESLSQEFPKLAGIVSETSVITHTNEHEQNDTQLDIHSPQSQNGPTTSESDRNYHSNVNARKQQDPSQLSQPSFLVQPSLFKPASYKQSSLAAAGNQIIELDKGRHGNTFQPQKSSNIQNESHLQIITEQEAGYPQPNLYNQHFINQYAFPKALQSYKKPEEMRRNNQDRVSIYDVKTDAERKGISGWKLTKKALPINGGSQMSPSQQYQDSISQFESNKVISPAPGKSINQSNLNIFSNANLIQRQYAGQMPIPREPNTLRLIENAHTTGKSFGIYELGSNSVEGSASEYMIGQQFLRTSQGDNPLMKQDSLANKSLHRF